ncbi:EF-hand calcium-binding domain-containing protein 9, partial [Phoenicopterus ruber ruber]
KLKSGCFLQHLCLDEVPCLLSVRNTAALAEYFQLLDVHRKNYLNSKRCLRARCFPDLQFYCFLRCATSLIMLLFDLLDRNATWWICFNEFYMVACVLLCHENHLEKQFMHRHTGPAFRLLDVDRDNMIDFNEFEATRFLFNIQKEELKKIFKDFDMSRDEQLNYREFKMFSVFCIDKQQQKEEGDHEKHPSRTSEL